MWLTGAEDKAHRTTWPQEYDWCWQGETIYAVAPESPDTRYAFVEVPQRRTAITMVGDEPVEHMVIDGLEMMYTTMYGYNDGWRMDYAVRGLSILNCHVGYVGIQGEGAAIGLQIWHSDMVVRNNEIHDCGRRSVSYNVYLDNGRSNSNLVFENVLFEYNVLYHGFHTTGFDVSCEPGTGGDSFGDEFRNFTFRNNFIWDDPADDPLDSPNDFTSMGIYLWGESATFTDFALYNNVLKHIKQKAIVLMGVTNTQVLHNTVYGMNARAGELGTGTAYRGLVTVSGAVDNLAIENNIFYGDVRSGQYYLQLVSFSGESPGGVTRMNHNLYYQVDSGQALVSLPSGSFDASDWVDYQASGLGWDADSPAPQDPLFVDPDNNDFHLRPASAAINAGAAVEGRSTDFDGNALVGAPDLGAFEAPGHLPPDGHSGVGVRNHHGFEERHGPDRRWRTL